MTSRSRTPDLRDDLLADLRQAAPPAVPAPPQAAPERASDEAAAPSSLDVRISWRPWSRPRLEAAPTGPGVVLTGGPLRLQLGLSRG